MKNKDSSKAPNEIPPLIYKNFTEFIETEIPVTPMDIAENGKVRRNQLWIIKFIDFLMPEIECCDENKNTNVMIEIPEKSKKKKNNEKTVPNSQLSLKKRKKIIKNMKHYPIDSNYYTKYGSTFGDYL